jgi:TRAP-type C4-dicarboxylate transport system permease small subunit
MLPLIAEIIYSAIKSFVLHDTPIWSFELTIFLYGSSFMLGGAYCHREKKHVAVEIFSEHVSPKRRKYLNIFSETVVLFVAAVMTWVSIPSAYRSTMILERSTHQTPFNPQVWWYKWIIPIACALVAVQAASDAYGLIVGRGTAKEREESKNVS